MTWISRSRDIARLSLEAQRLVELAGHDGEISGHLQKNPELVKGLDEYMAWRDGKNAAIACSSEQPSVKHPLIRKPSGR